MSLFSRLLALMITVGIAPLIPSGALLIYYQKQAKENILNTHHGFALAASTSVFQYMENLNQRLIFYAPLEKAIIRNQINQAENILKSAMQSNPDFLLSALLDENGSEELKIGTMDALRYIGEIDRSDSNVFLTAKKTGKIAVSNFKLLGNIPSAEIIMPIEKNKYLFLIADFSQLWSRITRQKIGLTGRIYLADENGTIFNFYSDISPAIDKKFLKEKFEKSSSDRISKISSKHGTFVGAYEKVPNFALYALTLQIKREAFWTITLTTSLILFIVLTISAAAYFAAWFFTSKISVPIANIIEGARRVARQDFSTPVEENKSFVELGELIISFNSMMGEVQKYSDMHIDKVLEEKNKTDLLIKLMRDGLVLADTSGKVLYSNAIAKSILESRDFSGFLGKDSPLKTLVEKIISKQKIPDIFEIKIGTGRDFYYYKLKYSVYEKNAETVIILVFYDVTLENRIDKMKEDFFGSVAHDLRAPLVGLQGYIKLLSAGKISAARKRQYLKIMETASLKVSALIENILDISKMESGTLTLKKSGFELAGFLKAVIAQLKPQVFAKKLKILTKIPRKTVMIEADERLLERVFVNLISNAIKYTPAGKKITITYYQAKEFHNFTVKDEGRGIEPEKLGKIFDKFYQTGTAVKGYGLGLAITKKIVELHGGTIEATSQISKGTAITFSLRKE